MRWIGRAVIRITENVQSGPPLLGERAGVRAVVIQIIPCLFPKILRRHRIMPAFCPRVTAANPFHRQPAPA